jgi:hypothetical protein
MPFHVEEKRKLGDCVLTGANLGTIAADAVHSIPGNRHDQDSLADYRCLDYPRLPDSQSAAQHTGGGPGGTVGQYQMMPVSGPGYCYVFVTDSKTGQTWKRDGMNANGEWQSLGSPAK